MKDRPGIALPPPSYPLLALLAAWVLDRFVLHVPLPLWARAPGALLAAAGFGLIPWAVRTFAKHRTAVDPYKPTTAIVASGPYAWSRNPIYLGFLVIQSGLALAFAWLWGLALLPATLLALRMLVIAKEETYLLRKFGADYAAYQQRVARWVGRRRAA